VKISSHTLLFEFSGETRAAVTLLVLFKDVSHLTGYDTILLAARALFFVPVRIKAAARDA
jgi:hypothetical protein